MNLLVSSQLDPPMISSHPWMTTSISGRLVNDDVRRLTEEINYNCRRTSLFDKMNPLMKPPDTNPPTPKSTTIAPS
jgi:hypothetical protein